jgi:hypothetical protein
MSLITEPSICIPRTLNNLRWYEIKNVFEKLFGKGTVERVDIVRDRAADSAFCRIFIHMRYWPMNRPEIAAWRQTLIDGGDLKVVYDQPWFWKCVASRTPKPVRTGRSEPYIAPSEDKGNGVEIKNEAAGLNGATEKLEAENDDE